MEQIIRNLLVADTELIQQASADLKEAFKRPEAVPQLCEIVVSHNDPQIRKYSAMLLKKQLSKLRNWQQVPVEQQALIKQGMLEAIVKEPDNSVRTAITAFVGILVRHEAAKDNVWMNEVLKFMFDSTSSSDPKMAEVGSATFATLADTSPDQLIPHFETVCQLFSSALVATEASGNMATPVVFNILQGMSHLVRFITGHPVAENTYQASIPYVTKALLGFAHQDSFKFIEAFDILENLADESSRILTPHVPLLIDFCLEIAKSPLDDSIRVKAITYIGWLVRLKKKIIIKQKYVEPIVFALFGLMSNDPDIEDEVEEYFGSNEVSTPSTCAAQTLDVLALHIPPKQLIPPLMALVEPALRGNSPLEKKAAYLSIAVIAEGCSEHICSKYLKPLLDVIKTGITDAHPLIRNAALFALGQFSEHLQPEISQYAEEILPILFEFLQQLCLQIRSGGMEPRHIDRVFYALETFCENLEDQLTPHLPILMDRLFEALDSRNTVHLRELSLTAIAATANAAKVHMLPYFPRLIDNLKMYLVKTEDEDICTLRPQAIDTFAALVRTIGKDNFLPLAVDTLNLGLTMLDGCNDPDLRRSCYNLFASMASSVKEDMAGSLSKIVESMLESVKSTEGIVPTFKDDGDDLALLNGADDDEEDDKEFDIEGSDTDDGGDDDDIAGYSVENAYMDEKEEAILALMEFAEHTGPAFAPFIQTAFEEIYKLINYPNEDIRKASIDALKQFVISLHELGNGEGVNQTILILIPKLSEIIRTDEERTVVMSALDGYSDILEKVGSATMQADGQKDAIFGCIVDVLNGKVACQFDEPVEEEQEESEYDEAIIESAGDILPKFGRALPPAEFAVYFGRVWPYFIQKIEKTKHKDETTDSQRAFAIGVLSECFSGLKEFTANWVESLLPIFLSCVQDRNNEVRNNAVYGIGEMVLHGTDCSYKHYPQILASLSNVVAKEQHAGTLDNICGALARLISTNSSQVPMKEVLPVFVQYLPLREDFEENLAVFRCFDVIYRQGNEYLIPLLGRVLVIGLQVLYKKQHNNDECRDLVFNFVKQINRDFPDKFAEVMRSDPEIASFVETLPLQ
ncbi:importin-4-like [Ochlerotatus camptorhynchus]|uniref:importin-4-like n=1 Tax=Ochlerotatus camptorhynchus TaxID=644619 RepID=UPI0031E3424F